MNNFLPKIQVNKEDQELIDEALKMEPDNKFLDNLRIHLKTFGEFTENQKGAVKHIIDMNSDLNEEHQKEIDKELDIEALDTGLPF